MGKREWLFKIDVKPLSINKAFQGRRYKTRECKSYEHFLMLAMPAGLKFEPPIKLVIKYGFSSKLADIDNPTKIIIDVMQKKYGFNDRDIVELHLYKEIVGKNKEYIAVNKL